MTETSASPEHLTSRRGLFGLAGTIALVGGLAACGDSATASSTGTSSTSAAAGTSSDSLVSLAEAFAATLSDEQQSALYQDYTFDNAQNWSNFPNALLAGTVSVGGTASADGSTAPSGDLPSGAAPTADGTGTAPSGGPGGSNSTGRVGVQTDTLSDEQWTAFKALMAAATGTGENEGWDEIQQILNADDYLASIDSGGGYGSGNYFIAFLGTPSTSGTWELQFGGHHLAFANTYTDGALAGATPSFRGLEPVAAFDYDGRTNAPLAQEVAAFTAVLAALDSDQLAAATVTTSDLVLGPGQDWAFPDTYEGTPVADMTDAQKSLVLAAVTTYVADVSSADATTILSRYESELDQTYVCCSGTGQFTARGDYIRIDGPSVWIELAMQPGLVFPDTPHIHSVWRDRNTDYGGLTG
ncbi:DUF3500 domain-containing protein [Kineococcus sp. SYSU DK003]|uniref:DUF3500 domain-containing protein n=1 Tax=Kineococcus sp. SYSU DK003 TaxID=3383124 RepID=UPI003D7C7CBF